MALLWTICWFILSALASALPNSPSVSLWNAGWNSEPMVLLTNGYDFEDATKKDYDDYAAALLSYDGAAILLTVEEKNGTTANCALFARFRELVAAKTGPSAFAKEPVNWTATRPKGTSQNYNVFQRNDINWQKPRTSGDARAIGMTNEEAARRFGLAPELNDGNFATLHHLGQDSRGGLVEASTRYHGVGKPGQDILHSQYGRNQPNPNFPIDRQRFDVDTREYWRFRANNE